ncbi:AAA family ATPase [Sphingomonas sp. 1P08PE]|uniref:AAA family ATPase n=1 Tax=Sphingomonas sp. 1P08PE TaxID=554122 RepID=UPI0039A014F3
MQTLEPVGYFQSARNQSPFGCHSMLKYISVKNYKSISEATLGNLNAINIIVGKSASGKTALLEAIRVGMSGLPSTLWNTSANRGGFLPMPQPPSSDAFESAWRPFFHDFNTHERISIELVDGMGRHAAIGAFIDRSTFMTVPTNVMPNGNIVSSSSINPFVMERINFAGESSRLSAYMNQHQGFVFEPGPELGYPSEIISSTMPVNFHQVANWFSSLSIDDQEHDIVQTVCAAFPNIAGITVQSMQGVPQLYASLRSQNRKLPLTSVSSGINKFVSILIAMKVHAGGAILIDEIENGIYFEMLPLLWETISLFTETTHTQVFATTHSLECLHSAASVLGTQPDRYSLIQVAQETGRTELYLSTGRDATNAIRGQIEVRR